MPGYEPSNWVGVIGLVVIAVAVISAAALPAWLTTRGNRRLRKDVSKVQDQVSNGHETPLRADLDGMRRDLQTVIERLDYHGDELRGMRKDIGTIHDEIRSDRTALREFEGRVTAAYKRDNPDVSPM